MRNQMRSQRRRSRERDRQARQLSEVLTEQVDLSDSPTEAPARYEHEDDSERTTQRPAGHDFSKMNVSAKGELGTKAEHAIIASDGRAPMLREGMALPGGAVMENVNVSASAVVALLQRLAIRGGGGFGANADFASNAGPQIDAAIGSMLNPRTVSGSFTETRGINCVWTWRVSFRMGEPVEIAGGGTGEVSRNYGGSGQISNSTTTSTTDSAKVTGGYKEGEAKSGGEGSVGGEVGTSTTRSETKGSQITTQGGGSAKTQNVLRRYRAPVIVEAQTQGDLEVSGTDYINPFKWGMYAAEAVDSISRETDTLTVGTLEYYRSEGIAQPAAPAAPAMRKGWIEHELGITDADEANFAKTAAALTVNPAELSRAGARPLVPDVADLHGASAVGPVNLIRGGPADEYCDSMSAAAFTTLVPGGGSDIYVHSGVDLTSPRGQHTLHHELAHAAQLRSGEAGALRGLGGDPSQRQELERRADEVATEMLTRRQRPVPDASVNESEETSRRRPGT